MSHAPDPANPDPANPDSPNPDTHVRWSEILTREHAPALALTSLSVWLHAATTLLLATMIDRILHDIGGETLVAWTVAVYLVGAIVAGSVSGLATARFGLRRPMAGAAAVFAFGCAVNAMAPSMPVLLLGRLLEGIGGGGLMAMAFVAVGRLFPPRLTARALAVVSTLWGVSALLGPLAGGLFVEFADWRWALWAFAAQAAALSVLIARLLRGETPPPRPEKTVRPPVLRLGLIAAGVASIAAAGVAPAPLRSGIFLVVGAAALGGALALDRARGEGRMFPAHAFRLTDRAGAALTMVLCMSFAVVSFTAFAPVLLIRLHGLSPMAAGYVTACVAAGWSSTAVVVSALPAHRDARMIAIGMCLVALALPGFALVIPHGPPAAVAAMAALEGMGFGMAWTFILRRARGLAGPGDEARVASALPTTQQLGFAAGAAFAGLAANVAGFGAGADAETLQGVARAVYLAPIPVVALGLWAMTRFVRG